MKNIRGVALFWAIAAFAGVAAIYLLLLMMGQMPHMSNDSYTSKLIPFKGIFFWFTIIPLVSFTIRYFFELIKTQYKYVIENLWEYTKSGIFVGILILLLSLHKLNIEHLPELLLFELSFATFASIFISDHIEGVVIATVSNMILVLVYFVWVTPYKSEFLFLLPGIAVTLLFINAILFSAWLLTISIIERIFSKEFWKSIGAGLQQAIEQ